MKPEPVGKPYISVIIPAKDAARTIGACVNALLEGQNFARPYEVIVVDDGSTDDTAQIATDLGATVLRQANAGPAAARNHGAQRAHGEILAFTDADCAPAPEWLYAISQPFTDSEIIGMKGTYRTHQTDLVPRFVQQEYAFKYRRMAKQPRIDFIDTYSAAYRRDVFLNNSGFETAFPVPSVEDQELSFRLTRKGYQMVFAPDAVVYHQHDENLSEYIRRKFGIGYWKAFMLRWLPEKTISDSHTPASQRWQIVLLAASLGLAVLGVLWPPLLWGALAFGLAMLASAASLTKHILKADPAVLLITPLMVVLRAAALGFGLFVGLLFPPKTALPKQIALSPLERVVKRGLDLVASACGLVLSLPLLLVAGIAIKLDSPGPVFFVQERAGENGKSFKVVKLRTMVADAEQRIAEVLPANPLHGPVYKIPNDPRVTRVGRFLRRWSIDELPQFWNILHGEMSLVGPRPEEQWVVEQYNDEQRQRLAFKPGLTGPCQINGRGDLDMPARLDLEVEYIKHYSFWKDLQIIAATIPAVIKGEGAF